ncbi:uncharacterized protein LOC144155790 isoform X2 [Haemaphysalis longicornis]
MAEDGKDGQPSIIVLVQDASEDDVVQALARNAQAMVGDQTEFTMNQLENAITAGGQQLLILSEDASESATDQEGTSHQESGLVCQEGPDKSLPEHPATAAESRQAESQPEPQESPDVNSGESPNAVSEEKTAGSSAAPEENSEGIQAELQPEPRESPDVNNGESPNAVSEEKTAGSPAAPEENSEGIQAELQPEPQKSPDVNNGESPNAVSEEKTAGSPAAPEENSEGIQAELQPEPQESPDVNNGESPNAISEEKAAGSRAAPEENSVGIRAELQPEPQESPDVNSGESPNAVSEEKAPGGPAVPEENSEGIEEGEREAEPQATSLAHSQEQNGNSECRLVSKSEVAVPLHENIEGDMPNKSEVLTDTCSQQKSPALPVGEPACDAGDGPSGLTGVSSGPSSNLPSENPAAVVCAAEAGSEPCLVSQKTEHEGPVEKSTSAITRPPSAVKEASEENMDHSGEKKTNEVMKALDNIPSFSGRNIQHEKAKEGNLCADQSTSDHSSVDTTPTCQLESNSSEKVAKITPQRTEAASEKPLKKRLRPEITGKTADQAVSLVSEFKALEVPSESEEAPLECGSPVGSEEKRAASDTSACPLHKETEHVVSIHVDKLPDRTATLTRGKVRQLSPSKTKGKASSNGNPVLIPDTDTQQVGSLQETGDTASLHEETKLRGTETMKHLTGPESSGELPGTFCSSEDRAVADMGPEKPSSSAHQGSASMVEGMTLPGISHSSKMDVQEEVGPADSATEPSAAPDDELTEISHGTDVQERDEPAGKPVQPQGDAVSEESETKRPRRLRRKIKLSRLDTSPTPARAETVDQQKSALSLDGESRQDTKGKLIDSTTNPEQSLQSGQKVEDLSSKAETADEPPHMLTERESPFRSSSETTMSREMPKLQQEAVPNHAAGSLMEDELQEPVNGLTSEASQDVAPAGDHEASQDAKPPTASKNVSQGSNQTAGSSQDSPKISSHKGNLHKGFREENLDLVHETFNNGATEEQELKHKEKAPEHRGGGDRLQKPQSQSGVDTLREEHVLVENSQASNRHDDNRGAAVECDSLAAQPSCSWQYEPQPSCSWAAVKHEPQPSCSWEGEDVNVPTAHEGKNAQNSGGKLLAALDLVPRHEGSPPSVSQGGGKKPLPKIRKKNKQAPQELVEVKEEMAPTTKPWNLRVPTKRRKRFVIPDSDDEDFDAYGSDDDPSEAQKLQSEKVFDDLLDHFKTEQAQKAVTDAAPARKRVGRKPGCAPSKRKPFTPQPLGTDGVTAGADERSPKVPKVEAEELVPEESTAETSEAKRTERRSAKIFKLRLKGYIEAQSGAKASKAKRLEKSAPTGSSAKTFKGKRMRKSAPNESPSMKTSKVKSTGRSAPEEGPLSPVTATSAAAEAQQWHVEPAGVLVLKRSESVDDIRMPRTDLLAGDIRIRCQKPSYVSATKLPPRYHCSKCDFVSSRMQNIVWHHKQDCPYTKSLSKKDPESTESQEETPT